MYKKIPEGGEAPGDHPPYWRKPSSAVDLYCNSFYTVGQRARTITFLEKQGLAFTVEFL